LQVSNQERLGLFQPGDCRFPADRREIREELIERLSLFKVVQQGLKGNASPLENWGSSKDVWVSNDSVIHSRHPISIAVYNQSRPGTKID
jgi:hypothetical protein